MEYTKLRVRQGEISPDDTSQMWASTTLGGTIFCLILPVRTLLHFLKKTEDEANQTKYKKVALSFPSDYDKENPLTIQKG